MKGMGELHSATKRGDSSCSASTTSRTSLSSFPKMASRSVSPVIKMRLSWSYQRVSSCVL